MPHDATYLHRWFNLMFSKVKKGAGYKLLSQILVSRDHVSMFECMVYFWFAPTVSVKSIKVLIVSLGVDIRSLLLVWCIFICVHSIVRLLKPLFSFLVSYKLLYFRYLLSHHALLCCKSHQGEHGIAYWAYFCVIPWCHEIVVLVCPCVLCVFMCVGL